MKAHRVFATLTATLLSWTAGPAFADDLNAVTSKLSAASAAVTSFVIEMHVTGTTGLSGNITFVRPGSVKTDMTMGGLSFETYIVDKVYYVHVPNGGWQKVQLDPAASHSLVVADALRSAKVQVLPDRQEDGMTVGVVTIDTQLPAIAGPIAQATVKQITCSYDKATFRMRTCGNNFITMSYTKYNDPSNVVTLPDAAKSATPLQVTVPSSGPATPLPSVSAPPAATPPPASPEPMASATPN